MSVLNQIAHFQGRQDEVPNQQLARQLAESRDQDGIQEIAANLWNPNSDIASDCVKVLYEVGYLAPELIASYAEDFIKLLKSKNNRLVWGGMLALSTIAPLKADTIFQHLPEIQRAMQQGSVITVDNGVKTLALAAAGDLARSQVIFPYLLDHLRTCRPKDVPQHAESTLPAVNDGNKGEFIAVLEERVGDLSASQAARVRKVIRVAGVR
jgi:hypothetical protein